MHIILCFGATGRGILFGAVEEYPTAGEPVTLTDACCVLYYPSGGTLGLAASGPPKGSRVTASVPQTTETVWREAVRITRAPNVSEVNRNKIQAVRTVHLADTSFHRWEVFEKIIMAIRQILGTKIGSRVIDREFGSDLRGIVFEPIDQLSATRLQLAVSEAIQTWEKRVELLNVEVSIIRAAEGVLEARVEFLVISTQQIGNLVYPFYLTPEMRVQGQITVS